jgi:septal ring factor EnvC (AmiA/AmiB activator)
MFTLLAQAVPDTSMNWTVVIALGTLASLAVSLMTLARFATGKSGERQIEPTQIAAIQLELSKQTTTLNNINREVGEVKTSVAKVEAETTGLHARVNSISRDLAGNAARVDGLERREGKNRA